MKCVQLCNSLNILWHYIFFRIGMRLDLFQLCGHCWIFQIFWHIEYSTLTAISFRIWNSSVGIPSPPVALFVVMLPKAHLTLQSRIQKTKIKASSSITSWQIDGETIETITDFIFLGSKITKDGDCSHEIKRHVLPGRRAMTNLDSTLKSEILL